jgi:hypothetical protein
MAVEPFADCQVTWEPRVWRACHVAYWAEWVLIAVTAQTLSMAGAVAALLLGAPLVVEGLLVFFNACGARTSLAGTRAWRHPTWGSARLSYRSTAAAYFLFGVVGMIAP